MNLVIDDAVEVRLATKTEEEKRRPLGMSVQWGEASYDRIQLANSRHRSNPP